MIVCPQCKRVTALQSFCQYCRYPISVQRLIEFSSADYVHLLTDLRSVLLKVSKACFNDPFLDQAYHETFNLHWLRPESALFSFLTIKAIRNYRELLTYPTLDLGCGDGTFSAILFGGQFHDYADNYGSVDLNKTDVHDHYTGSQKGILRIAPAKIGFGVDIKASAIANAWDLNVYDRLEVGDLRQLPFEDKCVNSVFSNVIDDIKEEDLPAVFAEIHRVLTVQGLVAFTSPTEHFRPGLFYYPKVQEALKENRLDAAEKFARYHRGRWEWQPRSKRFWHEFLSHRSFEMVAYEPVLEEEALKFWDTGFRPYFPVLASLREQLESAGLLREAKSIVVEIMKKFCFDVASLPPQPKPAFALIVARTTSRLPAGDD